MNNDVRRRLNRSGAVFYVLWGILHVVVGLYPVVLFAGSGAEAMLASIHGMAVVPSVEEPVRQMAYMIAQHYFNLVAVGIMAIWIAVRLNWKGSALGFWINVVVLGMVDLSFIVAEMAPGYMPVEVGIAGPILYVLGAGCTGAGLAAARRTPAVEAVG